MLIRAGLILVSVYWSGYWITGLAVAVLLLVWELLATLEGPPVLALALTYQWIQVTIGIFYYAVTGVELPAMIETDWQTMVLIGLGCITCLAVSLFYGITLMRRRMTPPEHAPLQVFSDKLLYIAYGSSLLLTGLVQELAWSYSAFTQAILAITFSHLALLFLLTRRFTNPVFQWRKLTLVMGIEIGLGFTGYFAGFREPVMMAAIAIFEVFDRRDVRHWGFAAVLAFVLGFSSLIWITARGQLRQEIDQEVVTASRLERFDRARTVSSGLMTQKSSDYVDASQVLIERMWAIYYPAMAVERVPFVVPYTGGQIMLDALSHLITPRFLYPEKADLESDSEMVRRYAGVKVAGVEENTSIAFGYAAESYVDYGLPYMFIPVLIFGFLLGLAYQAWLSVIQHRELAVSLVTVVFWITLYLFERSWVKTLGTSITMMVYLGGLTYLVDQWFLMRRAQRLSSGAVDPLLPAAE